MINNITKIKILRSLTHPKNGSPVYPDVQLHTGL